MCGDGWKGQGDQSQSFAMMGKDNVCVCVCVPIVDAFLPMCSCVVCEGMRGWASSVLVFGFVRDYRCFRQHDASVTSPLSSSDFGRWSDRFAFVESCSSNSNSVQAERRTARFRVLPNRIWGGGSVVFVFVFFLCLLWFGFATFSSLFVRSLAVS